MVNIVLDTNIWIYLTKDTFFELWVKLKEMKHSGQIRVIVNDVIVKEWRRNKENTIRALSENIRQEYKAAKNLLNYMPTAKKSNFEDLILEYKEEPQRIIKATEKVDNVEKFMLECTIIATKDSQKLYVANLAIDKSPPFQNNKNNFNDALIIRNVCEYVNDETPFEWNLIYVSNNPNDFIEKNSKNIFDGLVSDLDRVNIKNVVELGEALKMAPEYITDFEEWLENQLENQSMYELDILRGK